MTFIPLQIGSVRLGKKDPLVLISGPCVIESRDHALSSAENLQKLAMRAGVQLIYKSSYDKANRSSLASFRGPGLDKGLAILETIKQEFNLPVLTDVHTAEEASIAATVCDIIQIPAFLCRQTELLLAAGKTKCPINLKKGQFLAPWDIRHAVEKITSTGNRQIILTERGSSFGYNNLVFDPRSIPIMQKLNFAVCFDASHSIQLPGGEENQSGGQAEFIPTLAKAAIAAGTDLLFMESHPDPKRAKCDAASVISFDALERALSELVPLFQLVQNFTNYATSHQPF